MSDPNSFFAAASQGVPAVARPSLAAAWRDMSRSNGQDAEAERRLYWARWEAFCAELNLGHPTLPSVVWAAGSAQAQAYVQICMVFAQRYREGRLPNGDGVRVRSEGVEKALRAVGEMFALYSTSRVDPFRRSPPRRKLDLMFERQLTGYKKGDPLPAARTVAAPQGAAGHVGVQSGPRHCGRCRQITSEWSQNDPSCVLCRENYGCTPCRKDHGSFCSTCTRFWCFGCPGLGVTACDGCYGLFCPDCGDFKPGEGCEGNGGRLCRDCQGPRARSLPLRDICRGCGSRATAAGTRRCESCRGTHCAECACHICEDCNAFVCLQCVDYLDSPWCHDCGPDRFVCGNCCGEHADNQEDQPTTLESIPRYMRY